MIGAEKTKCNDETLRVVRTSIGKSATEMTRVGKRMLYCLVHIIMFQSAAMAANVAARRGVQSGRPRRHRRSAAAGDDARGTATLPSSNSCIWKGFANTTTLSWPQSLARGLPYLESSVYLWAAREHLATWVHDTCHLQRFYWVSIV